MRIISKGKLVENKVESAIEKAHEGSLTQAHRTVSKAAIIQSTISIEEGLIEVVILE